MIRDMAGGDIDQVVKVHLSSFPGFFLSFMGQNFLRTYYGSVCSSHGSICRVFLDDNSKISGFVVGARSPASFYKELFRRYFVSFVFAAAKAVLTRPAILPRLARTALGSTSGDPKDELTAGLFSIAVAPGSQGTGAGKRLIFSFCEAALSMGCDKVILTTDREDNDAVNSFYKRLGFAIDRQYTTREGRRMNRYIKMIEPGEGSKPSV